MDTTTPKMITVRVTHDGLFKETLEHFSDEQIIVYINAAFKENHPLDSEVARLSTESNGKVKRLSDMYIRIGDSSYHMELQSSPDGTMALRMFEYGFLGAIRHGQSPGGGVMRLTFPNPVVFYIRGGEQAPTELKLEVEFPHIGRTVEYNVPTVRMVDYTFKQLADERLIPLMMFYPLKYETPFGGGNERELFLEEVSSVPSVVEDLLKNGAVTPTQAQDVIDSFRDYALQMLEQSKIKKLKGDKQAMTKVEELDTIEHRSIWATIEHYKQEGIHEGRLDTIRTMLSVGATPQLIAQAAEKLGISNEELQQLRKESEADNH